MFFCITIYSFEVNTPCSVTASAKHLTNGLSKLLLNNPKLHMRFKLRLYLLQLCTLQCFKKLSLIDVLIPMRADVKKMFSISSSYEGVFFKSELLLSMQNISEICLLWFAIFFSIYDMESKQRCGYFT